MQTASRLAMKLGTFIPLSTLELDCLAEIETDPRQVLSGKELVREGENGKMAFILQSGWACSFKLVPEGNRQIIAFPIPGDCVGLRSVLLKTSDHSFATLTEATVSRIDAPRMLKVFKEFPPSRCGYTLGSITG